MNENLEQSINCAIDRVFHHLAEIFKEMAKHPELNLQEVLYGLSGALTIYAKVKKEIKSMKLTEVEKIILENTDVRFKYITRDKNGELFLYPEHPIKSEGIWIAKKGVYMGAFNHIFQYINWNDEEPYKFR